MKNKFQKDIEKYIKNFKDSNFGDLESLNKYEFNNLEFRNWYNNLKKCFIVIKDDILTDFIEFLELFVQEKEYQNEEEIFKFFYFLSCLDLYYEKKDEIIKLFFENIGKERKRELLKNLIQKINNLNLFPELKSNDIFKIYDFFSSYYGNFLGESIFNLFGDFYDEEIFPEIYELELKYFYVLTISTLINPKTYLIKTNKYLNDKEKFEYNILYFSSLDEDSNLTEEQCSLVENILLNNFENTKCIRYFFNKSFRNVYKIQNNYIFREIFQKVLEKKLVENNNFIKEVKYGNELALFIYFINYNNENSKINKWLYNYTFKKFIFHINNLINDGKLEDRIFNGVFYFNELFDLFLNTINSSIYLNNTNYKKWEETLSKLTSFCINLYYSNEFEIILDANSLVQEIILLHLAINNLEEDKLKEIPHVLEIIKDELLFKFLENSIFDAFREKYSHKFLYDIISKLNDSLLKVYNSDKKKYFLEFFSNWKKYSPLEWEWINRIGDETKL
ncbi:hypothetical protein [Fusobacterium pseudoperiodonticum]|uniref:hypothetical protein n=1 Tax=Fusobacterium pseudoperiodonticum TaxID=2663009 RepID=UPI000C1B84F0|nr:hypothetical protein [Fusobacterium pseudoperiodonticum]ATV63103.1 hypothetical protein CTM78_01005 [Fusobacterium pseudoperiodonticum]